MSGQPEPVQSLTDRRWIRARRHDEILDAAVAAFAASGYHGASMDEIARAAGVSKPVVYAQFGSKDELYVACLERAAHNFSESLEQAVRPHLEPEQRLWLGILTLLRHVERRRRDWTMLFDESARIGPVAAEALRVRRRTESLIADLLTESARSAGVAGSALEAMDALGAAFVGTAEGVTRWWLAHEDVPAENVAMYLMNYAWAGLGGMVSGQLWMPPA